eukprot:s2448_g8.t1
MNDGSHAEPGPDSDSYSDSDVAAPIAEEAERSEEVEEDEGLADSDDDAGDFDSTITAARARSDIAAADSVPAVPASAGSPRSIHGAGEDESEGDGEHSTHSESFDYESESSGEVRTSHPGQGDAAAGVGSSDAVALERHVMNKEWVKFLPGDLTNSPQSSPSALVSTTVHTQPRDDLELELENLMETIYHDSGYHDPVDSVDSAKEAHDTCNMGNAWAAYCMDCMVRRET